MQKLWAIVRGTYHWDHEHFDLDYNICVLLTNENIAKTQLEEADRLFYLQVLEVRKKHQEAISHKRKEQLQSYHQRKKQRIQRLGIL